MKQFLHSQPFSILLAVMMFLGLALHDTKLDTMTTMAIALPIAIASFEGANVLMSANDAHTHVEKVSVAEIAGRFTSRIPYTQTRNDKDKKYRLDNAVTKGHHAFDNYNLPIVY